MKALIDEALGQTGSRRVWEKPPYQGLETFDVAHALLFQGHYGEALAIYRLVERVDDFRRRLYASPLVSS